MSGKCVLKSLDPAYCDITLWNTDPVIVGRSRLTRIKDKRCSKQQVSVACNFSSRSCRVVQLGSNNSTVGGAPLLQGNEALALDGDVLEVLEDQYKYRIEFEPPPPKGGEQSTDIFDDTLNTAKSNRHDDRLNNINKDIKDEIKGEIPSSDNTDSNNKQLSSSSNSTKVTSSSNLFVSKIPVIKPLYTKDSKTNVIETMARTRTTKAGTSSGSENGKNNSQKRSSTDPPDTADTSGPASKRQRRDSPDRPASKKPAAIFTNAKPTTESSSAWRTVGNGGLLVYGQDALPGSDKIAGFDMDGTLITTQSGKVFAQDYNDWKILFSEVPGKLKSLHSDGYKIVIFTNQAGIESGKHTIAGVEGKIGRIIQRLGVPMQALVATGKGRYRKPAVGMWHYFQQHCNAGVTVDLTSSVYVGDAAGRPEVKKVRKKDHSSVDRLYALNVPLPFATPEEHFLDRKTEVFNMPEFDPRHLSTDLALYDPPSIKVPAHATEMIVMSGWPGSGKSVVATQVFVPLGYRHINRDTLGSWQKCVNVAANALKAGNSVVVDNTNPDKESRARYIKVATDMKLPVRCFVMDVNKDHARHNNKFRELTDPSHNRVSDMIYNMYKSKYQEPEKSEGFYDVVKVNFVPKFKNEDDEKLYKLYLLEK